MSTAITSERGCLHCGALVPHQGQCPRVKAIEYYQDGTVKRVEYREPLDVVSPAPYGIQGGIGKVSLP